MGIPRFSVRASVFGLTVQVGFGRGWAVQHPAPGHDLEEGEAMFIGEKVTLIYWKHSPATCRLISCALAPPGRKAFNGLVVDKQ